MKFRTELKLSPSEEKINHSNRIFFIGSCFSENIYQRMRLSGFNALSNPYGILFSPESIKNCLEQLVLNHKFSEDDFFMLNGTWNNFDLHSSLSSPQLDATISEINKLAGNAHEFIYRANIIVITFGTAWSYRHIATDKLVANCHKVPQKEFIKQKSGVNDIVSDYSYLLNRLKNMNPELRVVFTTSPVRHLKDGFVENQWSKSTLNIAIHELVRRHDFVTYFPAYEIMMDDLRDYRFYNEDLLHPNAQAIEYIWECFSTHYFSQETQHLANEVEVVFRSKAHRSLHPGSEEDLKFKMNLEKQVTELQEKLPWIDLLN